MKKLIVRDLRGLDKETISKIETPMFYLGVYEESGDIFADLRNSKGDAIRIFHERLNLIKNEFTYQNPQITS